LTGFQLADDEKMVSELSALLKRRGFYFPSYEIYGGTAGFFDLGPMGSILKENILSRWKERFIVKEGFLLVDCPSLTPEVVFRHSGHLEKFTDMLTRCSSCNEAFRADHLLEGKVENPDSLDDEELWKSLKDNEIKCPNCGGEVGRPEEFNLMFKTHIGPGTDRTAYLRPETAQSIFLDFSLLHRMNREKVPFGVAQIGKGFRNEISPRQGLLRQREFNMAEGEFFYDPLEKDLSRFNEFGNLQVNLVPNTDPDRTISMTLDEAVLKGIIRSKILAHFLGVTYSFASEIGIPGEYMRFREHLKNEMAHYASDCWDLEVLTSFGWIEMVGIADRSAYDLSQHKEGSGQDLTAMRRYAEPIVRKATSIDVDMKKLGPVFRGRAREVKEAVEELEPSLVKKLLEEDGAVRVRISSGEVDVPPESLSVSEVEKRVAGERYVPHVVEPSFGIDRLMVAVIEHAYFEAESSPFGKDGEGDGGPYRVMRLLPAMAPVKCGVFPLMNKDGLPELAKPLEVDLRKRGLITYFDHSGSIGRRYARMDEIGTPFNVTVDYDSRDDSCATIRERDSGIQKRIPMNAIPGIVEDLIFGRTDFDDLDYPRAN
jgi:glycyl-tRNA synthetase